MRPALRLLPLPLSIALCLPALADDEKPESWALCPIQDAVPAFGEAPQAPAPGNAQATREQRADQPTSIEGDQLSGTEANPEYSGAVVLTRGDQFLGADNLKRRLAYSTISQLGLMFRWLIDDVSGASGDIPWVLSRLLQIRG